MNLGFSASLAFVLGVLLPILGLVRSWTMSDPDASTFIADLMCGGMLLLAAVKTRQRAHTGQRFLAAAYGLTFGMFYSGLMFQLRPRVEPVARPDGSIPEEWMIVPTIVGLLITGVGLLTSLRSIRSK
jgi:hypothetical protein